MILFRSRMVVIPLAAALSLASTVAFAVPQIAGVPNFRQVNERLYRGGQPADDAWGDLARLGVKTVIDLRREEEHSTTGEAKLVEAAGMRYVSIPMNGFDTPTAESIGRALAAIDGGQTVFVHCKQGRDRTGSVVAAYRIAREQWTCDKALVEAKACGMHWYERGMMRFINGYQGSPALASRPVTPPSAAAPVAAGLDSLATAPH